MPIIEGRASFIRVVKQIALALTVFHAHQSVVHQLEPGGTRAGNLRTATVDLWRWQTEMRAVPVDGLTVVGTVRLAVRVVHVDCHRVLELSEYDN